LNKKNSLYVAVLAGWLAFGGAVLVAQDKRATAPAGQAQQPDPSRVVIEMKGAQVTAGEFEAFLLALPAEARQMAFGPMKRQLAEELIRLKLLAGEARRLGIDQQPRYEQQMALMRENVLVGMLLQDIQNQQVTEQEIQKHYAEHSGMERVTARHILIPMVGDARLPEPQARARADAIHKELAAMTSEELVKSFAEIARRESADPGSREEGGLLQQFGRGVMIPAFEAAAFTQEIGTVGPPVRTDFGYHLILVIDRSLPPLERMKDDIADDIRQSRFHGLYDRLRKEADPKLDEGFFPAPAR
jgi:peptidyl-prolyl cis-trans isomerase C